MTAGGPVLIVSPHRSNETGCSGLLVVRLGADEPLCLEGVGSGAWSPDGSTLATISSDAAGLRVDLWDPVNGLREVTSVENGHLIGWNPQDTHLLVSDVGGI